MEQGQGWFGWVVGLVVVSAAAPGAVGNQLANFVVGEPKQSKVAAVQSPVLGAREAERAEICPIVLGRRRRRRRLRSPSLPRCGCWLDGITIAKQVKCLLGGCCRSRRQGGEAEESSRSHCSVMCVLCLEACR